MSAGRREAVKQGGGAAGAEGDGANQPVSASALRIWWPLWGRMPVARKAESKGTLSYVAEATNHHFQGVVRSIQCRQHH